MPGNTEIDKKQIDLVVDRFFAAFDNRDGKTARLDNLKDLCVPECLLVKTCGNSPTVYGLADFIAPRHQLLNGGELLEFFEAELSESTRIFGSIAQRFCSYEKSGRHSGNHFEARGMKSFQFVKCGSDWMISSVIWDDERDGAQLDNRS